MIAQYVTRYIRCKFIRKYLADKGVIIAADRALAKRQGGGFIRAGYESKKDL